MNSRKQHLALSRRRFLQAAIVASTSALLSTTPLQAADPRSAVSASGSNTIGTDLASGDRPNVLLITCESMRTDLGCYGHPVVLSPNIDRLASEGTLFKRAYCQQALCGPSRASVFSGLRPDTIGIHDNITRFRDAAPNVLSLPEYFRNNGYVTIAIGKNYHHAKSDKVGWSRDLWPIPGQERVDPIPRDERDAWSAEDVPDNELVDGVNTDLAIEWLRKLKDKKFFLSVGLIKPHLPFDAPRSYWDKYSKSTISLPDTTKPKGAPKIAYSDWPGLRAYRDIPEDGALSTEKTAQLIHGYYACVSHVDAQIGRLLDTLADLGLNENTVVLLWCDHGGKLGEYGEWLKSTNFEYDVHVPLIIKAPGMRSGQTSSALVENLDIYPTLADLCNLPIPEHCEGESLRPLLREPETTWRYGALSQCLHETNVMGYSLRTVNYRYTTWIDRDTGDTIALELYDQRNGPFVYENLAPQPVRPRVYLPFFP